MSYSCDQCSREAIYGYCEDHHKTFDDCIRFTIENVLGQPIIHFYVHKNYFDAHTDMEELCLQFQDEWETNLEKIFKKRLKLKSKKS